MLELIHDYALERLRASGQAEQVQCLHAEHYLSLVELAERDLVDGTAQVQWLNRLDIEYDNIRGALRWLLDMGRSTDALRLAAAMNPYWNIRGRHIEGCQWVEKALASGGDAPAVTRAMALETLGLFAQSENDHEKSTEWLEESLALIQRTGECGRDCTNAQNSGTDGDSPG